MATDNNDKSFCYCGDLNGAIYLHSQHNGGQYADMDIDCDGANDKGGKCANDPSGQGITAFQDRVQGYGKGISDLDSNVHPYVVYGNSGSSPTFDPAKNGIEPVSVMAVVCNSQLVCNHTMPMQISGKRLLTLCSTTQSGVIQMEEHSSEKHPSHWLIFAFQMRTLMVTTDM
jgi:hypothetical protein